MKAEKNPLTILLQVIFLTAPFLLVFALWARFPENVATHWDIHGRPNGWMPRAAGLLLMPLINIGFCATFSALPYLDARLRKQTESNESTRKVMLTFRLTFNAFFCFLSFLIPLAALGVRFDISRVIMNGCLILFMILGNFMGNLRPNFVAGIRTPWTLKDPEVWRSTNRLCGHLFFWGSLALLAIQWLITSERLLWVFLAYAIGISLWGIAFSYFAYRKKHTLQIKA